MKSTRRKRRIRLILMLVLIIALSSTVYTAVLAVRGNEDYTESVELLLASMVPKEGLKIKDRTYKYEDVLNFLEEVRWEPDDYVHKDHHCALSELPEEEVRAIVTFFRVVMDCPTTYTDYETVLKVQQRLNQEGFACGAEDGLLGPLTYTALNAYQEEHGLRKINAITEELLTEMGVSIPND